MKIAVTGASGLVGRHVTRRLASMGHSIVALMRSPSSNATESLHDPTSRIVDYASPSSLAGALRGCDVVVHLAARTHRGEKRFVQDDEFFDDVNVRVTRSVVDASVAAGVSAFVFVSSIKAVGNTSNTALTEEVQPAPDDAYGRSKLRAERLIETGCTSHGIRHVIVRLPIVVARRAGGNLRLLRTVARRGIPVPFASIDNARSVVGLQTIAAFIDVASRSGSVKGTYHLAEATPVSTPRLFEAIAIAEQRPVRMFKVDPACLRQVAKMVGRAEMAERLCGNLVVQSVRLDRVEGWQPRDASLQDMLADLSVAEGMT